jgi:hypothetical protein
MAFGGPGSIESPMKNLESTLRRSKGGQFIVHAKALPGNSYVGQTLASVIPEIETQIGDRGYRGHDARPATRSRSSSPARDAASPMLWGRV